jgi:hypothetical protein
MNLTTAIIQDYQVSRCSRNQDFNASFMRVCQPRPVALKASSTSASKRTVVKTLVGDFCLPRPDNLAFNDSGNSENGLNNAGSTFDKSPTSPSVSILGNRETMGSSFSFVSFAKTDDTNAALSLTERQHMQPVVQVADGDKARFRVFNARVLPDFSGFKIKIDRAFKAQAAFSDVFSVLGGIEFNYHVFIVVTNRQIHKHFVTTFDKPSIRAYPSRAAESSVAGFGSLGWSGDEPQALCSAAFFMSSVASMAALGREPQGSPVLHRSSNLFRVRHPFGSGGGSLNELERIMTTITILTTQIRQHDGLYSLNDLHKAAGGESKHQPALFMRNEQTQSLIEEIKSTDSQICTKTVHGGKGGTYACRELVIAYAAWISAKFHLQVIRVFLEQALPDQSTIDVNQIEKLIQKQLQKSLPVSLAHDCLLPPQQAKEITDRLNRLASMFHPFSDQFADVMGVIRALRGCNPKLGLEEQGYRKVIDPKNK